MKKLVGLVLALSIGILTVGCGSSGRSEQTASGEEKKTIKLGVNGTDFRVWDYVEGELEKKN